MKKNEAADKKKIQINKKIVPANKKIVPIDKKIVPANKKIVPMNKKLVSTDKKIVQMDKKIISTDKKVVSVPMDKKIVPTDKNIVPTDKKITLTGNFQIKIFQEINKSNIGKNIMISPLSIYHILSLTANGAANKTLEEMVQALSEKNLNELNNNNKLISSSISNFKSVELANAVFTRFKPLENFIKIVEEYKAKLDELKDAAQINKWCSDATHQKIPKIVDNISGSDKMVLINAIYFKGKWQQPFNKNDTRLDTFMNFNKQPKKVNFMNSKEKFDYFEDDNIQAISLNYDKDNLKALVILPKKKTGINTYIKNFTSEKYHIIIKELINKKVILSLPKFEIDFSDELSSNFQALGMKEAFSKSADFSAMKKEKDFSLIIHKTFIKVDEKGTEAAAATAVVMRAMSASPPEPVPIMKVDHPFLFIIRNNDLPHENDMIFISKVECL
jgi:serpin B